MYVEGRLLQVALQRKRLGPILREGVFLLIDGYSLEVRRLYGVLLVWNDKKRSEEVEKVLSPFVGSNVYIQGTELECELPISDTYQEFHLILYTFCALEEDKPC